MMISVDQITKIFTGIITEKVKEYVKQRKKQREIKKTASKIIEHIIKSEYTRLKYHPKSLEHKELNIITNMLEKMNILKSFDTINKELETYNIKLRSKNKILYILSCIHEEVTKTIYNMLPVDIQSVIDIVKNSNKKNNYFSTNDKLDVRCIYAEHIKNKYNKCRFDKILHDTDLEGEILIDEIYVEQEFIKANDLYFSGFHKEYINTINDSNDISKDLVDTDIIGEDKFRNLILSQTGSGKSTYLLLNTLAYLDSNIQVKFRNNFPLRNLFPIYIICKDIKNPSATFDEIIFDQLNKCFCNVNAKNKDTKMNILRQYVDEEIDDGNALLLIDGLDELDKGKDKELVANLRSFLNEYPNLNVIVSGRNYIDKEPFVSMNFKMYALKDLGIKQKELLSKKLFLQTSINKYTSPSKLREKVWDFLKEIETNPDIKELSHNHLHFTLIFMLYKRKGSLANMNLYTLYYELNKLLLKEWDKGKDLEKKFLERRCFSFYSAQSFLAVLSHEMMSKKQGKMPIKEINELFKTLKYNQDECRFYLEFNDVTASDGDELIQSISNSSYIVYKSFDETYDFYYNTFKYYYLAWAIVENKILNYNNNHTIIDYLIKIDKDIFINQEYFYTLRFIIMMCNHSNSTDKHKAVLLIKDQLISLLSNENKNSQYSEDVVYYLRTLLWELVLRISRLLSPNKKKEIYEVVFNKGITEKQLPLFDELMNSNDAKLFSDFIKEKDDEENWNKDHYKSFSFEYTVMASLSLVWQYIDNGTLLTKYIDLYDFNNSNIYTKLKKLNIIDNILYLCSCDYFKEKYAYIYDNLIDRIPKLIEIIKYELQSNNQMLFTFAIGDYNNFIQFLEYSDISDTKAEYFKTEIQNIINQDIITKVLNMIIDSKTTPFYFFFNNIPCLRITNLQLNDRDALLKTLEEIIQLKKYSLGLKRGAFYALSLLKELVIYKEKYQDIYDKCSEQFYDFEDTIYRLNQLLI